MSMDFENVLLMDVKIKLRSWLCVVNITNSKPHVREKKKK